MTAQTLPPPVLLSQTREIEELAGQLRRQPKIAVDTESNSLFAYREQVCLIQFSTPQEDFLVDPLAAGDLSALQPVFADPQVEKIFHAAEYDLICLRRDFGFTFTNIFDTMLACRILGREATGLGALLAEEFGVKLDKRGQRANWGERPLPVSLLDYARLDTHYLIPLRERLAEQLRQRGFWALAEEDFRRLAAVRSNAIEAEANGAAVDCWRISGAYDLTPQQAAVLQELCRYRDHIARRYNRPLFKVISDATLLAIAAQTPRSLDDLRRLPGMSTLQIKRHGPALLQAVQRGLQASPLYPPRSPRPAESYLERLEALKRWRKAAGLDMGVPSDVILPRDLMYALASQAPRERSELAAILKDSPWRLEHLGAQILSVLQQTNTEP